MRDDGRGRDACGDCSDGSPADAATVATTGPRRCATTALDRRIDDLLASHPPGATDDAVFLGAQFDAGRGPVRSYRTDDPGAANTSGSWVGTAYNAVAGTIYAGTSEIQRTILGESVFGPPREPRRP